MWLWYIIDKKLQICLVRRILEAPIRSMQFSHRHFFCVCVHIVIQELLTSVLLDIHSQYTHQPPWPAAKLPLVTAQSKMVTITKSIPCILRETKKFSLIISIFTRVRKWYHIFLHVIRNKRNTLMHPTIYIYGRWLLVRCVKCMTIHFTIIISTINIARYIDGYWKSTKTKVTTPHWLKAKAFYLIKWIIRRR